MNNKPVRREIKADDGNWFIRSMLPYRSDHKSTEGLVITFAGISEIKAAEIESEAARAYLDSIIATIREPLVVLDEDLRIVSASSSFQRIFSIAPEQFVGRNLFEASTHLDVPAMHALMTSIKAQDVSIKDHQIEIEVPAAGLRAFSVSTRVLREPPQAKRKILLSAVDVTDSKHVAAELDAAKLEAERANRAKSRFLAAASHDLRQPLQSINLLQGMLEKRITDAPTLKLVRHLDETVTSMASMLDKLLDINQLEAGIVTPEIVDFPIQRLLDELQSVITFHTVATGLGWRVVPCGLTVRSDPRLLEQIIRNLVSNAIKYTSEGRILLGCRRRGDMLRIQVCDTGPGIPELELEAIFEEFHQLENPARERSKGLGLGLAIVQRLANLLGHPVDVRSRPGVGSTFFVDVPIARATVEGVPPSVKLTAVAKKPRLGTVLIVEDDPAMLKLFQLLFEGEGHRTLVAANGRAALKLVEKLATFPDLIVSDYNLPMGQNGLAVIEKLQALAPRLIPAIILTGDISAGSLSDIAKSGCVHLSKPVSVKELTLVAHRLLAKDITAKPRQTSSQLRESHPRNFRGAAPPTVFIVDDEPAVREGLRDLLLDDGYLVEMFADGAAFFDAYRPGRAECLLVDAQMPGMSGIEVIERLKSEGHSLPAIVITGHGDVALAVQAMKAGAVEFIEKPVRHVELLELIAGALDRTAGSAPPVGGAGPGNGSRCQLDRASTRDSGPRARRPPQQEHRSRHRHQPAHRRQPPRCYHAKDWLEDPFRAAPHGTGCGLMSQALLDLCLRGRPAGAIATAVIEGGCAVVFSTGSSASDVPVAFQDWPVLCKPYKGKDVLLRLLWRSMLGRL